MTFPVEEIPELRGYTVEWAEPGNYFLSRRNIIFHSSTLKPPFKEFAVIDAPGWKSVASNLRLAQRLLRFMVTNVVPLSNGEVFVTFDKSVGVIRDGKYRSLGGLIRPCRVLRSACAIDDRGSVFFGEYLANNERGEMRIYKYTPGSDALAVLHTFPARSIKHIHGIYFDEFSGSLICLTGDDENECRMLRTYDDFQTIEVIGEGDETWRAVSVLFSEDSLFYGMDAEFRTNHIYRFDRSTLERRSLGEVSGTVFYSKSLGSDLFFTTTAENAPAQKENVAALWYTNGDTQPLEQIRFKKDRWNGTLFMFGTIHFPYVNRADGKLYFSLVAVEGDNRTFALNSVAPDYSAL